MADFQLTTPVAFLIFNRPETFLKKIIYTGNKCYCPISETSLCQFYPAGIVPRENARCPVCGSLERHRMIWLYWNHETDLLVPRQKRSLNIAPASCFVDKLSECPYRDYLSADLLALLDFV
jgi:hypothetical protein